MPKFKIGQRVIVNMPGTWSHGYRGQIVSVDKRHKQYSIVFDPPNDYLGGSYAYSESELREA